MADYNGEADWRNETLGYSTSDDVSGGVNLPEME